jgi:hypothetical protein
MLLTVVLGVWALASIIVTPMIGYILYVANRQHESPKCVARDISLRPKSWNYVKSRRQLRPRRAALVEQYRHGRRAS